MVTSITKSIRVWMIAALLGLSGVTVSGTQKVLVVDGYESYQVAVVRITPQNEPDPGFIG
ncbi:MAG: hypothetical protein KF893_24325 [Caldilineaceae bacterium]|nr:hypothetical protein [Caldilineaceae bacterium]